MLARIRVLQVHDIHDVMTALDAVTVQLQAQRRAAAADSHAARTSMLILDSASAAIAPVLGAGGPSSQGHALMVLLAQQLKSMAQAYMLVALITNHTVGGQGAAEARPALGETWKNQPHLRVQLAFEDTPGSHGRRQYPEGVPTRDSRAEHNAAEQRPAASGMGQKSAVRRAVLHSCSFAACGEGTAFELGSSGAIAAAAQP